MNRLKLLSIPLNYLAMTNAPATSRVKIKEFTVLFSSTILITLFLFFIDEGYYNFKWMINIGNWIVFIVYAAAILFGQLLISRVLLRNYRGSGKIMLSVIGGATIGVLFVIGVIFTN